MHKKTKFLAAAGALALTAAGSATGTALASTTHPAATDQLPSGAVWCVEFDTNIPHYDYNRAACPAGTYVVGADPHTIEVEQPGTATRQVCTLASGVIGWVPIYTCQAPR